MVDLVEDADARHLVGADFLQHRVGDLELALETGIAGVDDVQQQAGVQGLVQGRLERGHQPVRQVLDEADGVADQHARHALGVERAHGGVERGEELVGDQHLAAGERAHQGGLAGIGVADQRHAGEALAPLAARTLGLAFGLHRDDLQLQLGDAIADLAAIELGVRLAGAATAHAAALPPLRPGELGGLAQARRHVAQASDLHLRPGRARACVAVEDLEDDHGAVHHLAAGLQLEIARLRGRDLVVDQQRLDRAGARHGVGRCGLEAGLGGHELAHLLALADPQIAVGVEAGALLGEGVHHAVAERLRQLAQFGERGFELGVADVGALHRGDDGLARFVGEVCLHSGHFYRWDGVRW